MHALLHASNKHAYEKLFQQQNSTKRISLSPISRFAIRFVISLSLTHNLQSWLLDGPKIFWVMCCAHMKTVNLCVQFVAVAFLLFSLIFALQFSCVFGEFLGENILR